MLPDDITNPYTDNKNEIQKIFDIYLSECEHTRRLSKQTIKTYIDVFNTFQKIVPEVISPKDLNAHAVREFFRRLSTRKRTVGKTVHVGVKASTTSTYFSKLIVFFKWLERNEYLKQGEITSKIPAPPKPKYEDERALTDDEVSKIIATITLRTVSDNFLFARDLAIISILLYTGIRRGELLGLRVQDIDFNERTLFVNRLTSKSKKDRSIPLHETLIAHLKNYLVERNKRGYMTPSLITSSLKDAPLTAHGLKHWVKKYKEWSGVPFHLHRCRHTFACTLAKTGSDITSIMRLLGHSTMRMTERYLRSIQSEDARGHIDKMSF